MKNKVLTKLLLIITVIILSLSLSLFMTTFMSQWIFPFFVKHLGLNDLVGLTVEEVQISYQEIIKFLLIPNGKSFEMTYFKSSPEAIVHFSDVKMLFFMMAFVGGVAFICSIFLRQNIKIKRHIKDLKQYFNIGLVLPIGVLSFLIIFFDKVFMVFHKLFFQNDYWLFDPAKDPVILVLPHSYFLTLVLVWVLFYSLVMFILKYMYTK